MNIAHYFPLITYFNDMYKNEKKHDRYRVMQNLYPFTYFVIIK